MPDKARLRIHGNGGVEVNVVSGYLKALSHAYSSLLLFDAVIPSEQGNARPWPPWRERFWNGFWPGILWPPMDEQVACAVPLAERLTLNSARLESPGVWEFLGTLNPLEVIRQYLNDRNERAKDRSYRNEAERRKLELENLLLETKLIKERVEAARMLGASDRDLAPVLNGLVLKPLEALDVYQDQGVISTAEILPLEDEGRYRKR